MDELDFLEETVTRDSAEWGRKLVAMNKCELSLMSISTLDFSFQVLLVPFT
jgi:hypothetical protein